MNDEKPQVTPPLPYWVPPGASFEVRLRALARPIARHHGVYFPIVVDSGTVDYAGMDYEKVYFNRVMARFPDELLFSIMAHEWAHRTKSPGSRENNQRISQLVASRLRIKLEEAEILAGCAYELLVDRYNAAHPTWGQLYINSLVDFFWWVFEHMDAKRPKGTNAKVLGIQHLFDALRYANLTSEPVPATRSTSESRVRQLVSILFETDDGDDGEDERIVRFAERLLDDLPRPWPNELGMLDSLLQSLGRLVKQLDRFTLPGVAPGAGPGGIGAGNPGAAQTKKTIDLRITRQVTGLLLRLSQKSRQIPGIWHISSPRSRLDLKRSYRTSPVLIPGLTTRQMVPSARLSRRPGEDRLKLCLVVDDSGSMGGEEALFTRSLCEGINRFAEITGTPLGLITFGNEVNCSIQPGFRYGDINASVLKLDGHLGGTQLDPALELLAGWLQGDRAISHVLLITDAELADWNLTARRLESMVNKARWTVLLINSRVPDELGNNLAPDRRRIVTYQIDPSLRPSDAVLKEIVR